ncbi:hypothetical protein [Pseudomonas pharyngis]|uniref:hypothetical protein n=1 Tax=Pseudomonas pharyngis TaxID=2892333 RepID=UPI001F1DC661|nr:hypothetical protein [Pseudomonas pharyngis]
MHRIDGPGATVDKKFTDGDPVGGVPATVVTDEWLNDVQENIMAVLSAGGVAPTKGRAADLLDSIRKIGVGVVGAVRNAKMSLTTASSSATFTADEVVVETAIGGLQYRLSSFNKTINVSTVGAGGMDTGAPSPSGFVSIYAIYNPTTQASALLACIQTVSNGSIYTGANMPSGYTASALVASWPITAASILSVGFLSDRTVAIPAVSVLNSSAIVSSQASLSISNAVPSNARSINGYVSVSSTSASNLGVTLFSSSSVTGGAQPFIWGSCPPNALQQGGFSGLQIAVPSVIGYTTASTVGTPNFQININSYSF